MAQSVTINFAMDGPGWANLEFLIGEHKFVADSISYTTDALGDLVRAAIMVATGAENATASFDREPAEWRLQLHSLLDVTTGIGSVQIRVLEFDDIYAAKPASEGREVFVASCASLEFARAVLVTANDVREKFGEFGLEFLSFPSAAVHALDAALSGYENH
jgi:hypothetical protein